MGEGRLLNKGEDCVSLISGMAIAFFLSGTLGKTTSFGRCFMMISLMAMNLGVALPASFMGAS